jgi:hypothetical protein
VAVNHGDTADDTKFKPTKAEANGAGDYSVGVEDFKSDVADEFDGVSCVVVCI